MANDVLFIVCLLVQNFVFTSSVTSTDDTKCQCDEGKINRDDFPEGFLFGAATSAYQEVISNHKSSSRIWYPFLPFQFLQRFAERREFESGFHCKIQIF
ncbi:hypothetical protein M9H77_07596 [Catharanthus roseus]|uniref:Uncharacterized protein n=1 Tax=Catharanthus roseus TaxID=4058 RepID=A0ACC0BVM8_CATRO|nr:hypothetical protein M9H77_07596 [Catharanthus roseus]